MNTESLSAKALRALCRNGTFAGPTAGFAKGHVQANMMIVPREYAFDFLLFCQRNPKPCPLVEVLEPGQFTPRCAPDADIRSDLPGYRIFEHGELRQEVKDITAVWRDDFVSFLIGCSFSFENALIEGGIPLRHVQQQLNVAMYRTNIPCLPAGRFQGNMVVSMRPVKSRDIARAVEISGRFPQVHGAPVHIGHPQAIGIADLSRPDFGDAVAIDEDELPVFWACGVTPQYVAERSRIPFCISHSPGKMLVTDLTTE
ncbi:MAG: putative hydro-lyase [Noviherbaspirillum sp.]